jgi:hypothetical protein
MEPHAWSDDNDEVIISVIMHEIMLAGYFSNQRICIKYLLVTRTTNFIFASWHP